MQQIDSESSMYMKSSSVMVPKGTAIEAFSQNISQPQEDEFTVKKVEKGLGDQFRTITDCGISKSQVTNDIIEPNFRIPFTPYSVVQVPSPWINSISSPSGTPVIASPLLSQLADTPQLQMPISTPLGSPYLTSFNSHSASHTPMHYSLSTPMVSPYFGSPFLSPNEFTNSFAFNNESSKDTFSEEVDFLTWLNSQKDLDFVKPFTELLAETGLQAASILDSNKIENQNSPNIAGESMPDGKFWTSVQSDGKTLYKCPYNQCGKKFTRPYNLKSHYRSHTGERPYACDYQDCSLKFSRKYDLKRHQKLHSGIKQVTCPNCSKQFVRTDYLRRHLRIQENKKETECDIYIRTQRDSKI